MRTKLDIYGFFKASNEIVPLYICYEFHVCLSKSMSLKRKHSVSDDQDRQVVKKSTQDVSKNRNGSKTMTLQTKKS